MSNEGYATETAYQEPPPPPRDDNRTLRTCLLIGGGGALVLFVLVPCCVIALLTVMGPQIGTVFSEITEGLASPGVATPEITLPDIEPPDVDIPEGSTPEPPAPGGVDTDVFNLGVGDCILEEGNAATGLVSELTVVPCDQPHDREIYASAIHPAGAGEPFPGDEALDEFWEPECVAAFEAFVGIPYDESVLYISTLEPTEQSWENGDREILCILYEPEVRLDRSMEGSER